MLLCLLVSRHHSECWGIGSKKQSLSSSRELALQEGWQADSNLHGGRTSLTTAPHQFSAEHLILTNLQSVLIPQAAQAHGAYLAGSFSSLSWWWGWRCSDKASHNLYNGKETNLSGKSLRKGGYLTRNLMCRSSYLGQVNCKNLPRSTVYYWSISIFSFYELDTRHSWMAPIFLKHSSHVFQGTQFSLFLPVCSVLSNSSSLSRVSHLGHMIHLTRTTWLSDMSVILRSSESMCKWSGDVPALPSELSPITFFSSLLLLYQSPSLLSSLGWRGYSVSLSKLICQNIIQRHCVFKTVTPFHLPLHFENIPISHKVSMTQHLPSSPTYLVCPMHAMV